MDYKIDISIKNNRILRFMRELGYENVASFCRASGMSHSSVSDLIKLKKPAVNERGEWMPSVIKLAEFLCCEPDDLFTDAQRQMALDSNIRSIDADESQVAAIVDKSESAYLQIIDGTKNKLANEIINESLHGYGVIDRQDLIKMRYGIEPYRRVYTFAEIAEKYGVSKERIRQVETEAMRRMRRHIANRHDLSEVRDLIDEDDDFLIEQLEMKS